MTIANLHRERLHHEPAGRERSRREFLSGAGSFAFAAALARPARAAMAPDDKFDLVIKNADVLDPSQSLRGRRDIGIRYGSIEAVEADIPAARALRVLDAGGKLVTPGLVDLHCHVYPYGSAIGIPADELVPHQCSTTCVSAGDAGANNFAAFRRYVVAQTRTRLYAFVHIANMGLAPFPVAELYNIDFAQVDVAAKAVAENADMVLGVKVRMSENVIAKHGLEPLKRAIAACEGAGTGGKIMCHIGGVETRELMAQILDTLRPGDILTHAYSGAPNLGGAFTNIVQEARLLPAALAAKQRGVIFDVGHGGGSFDFTVAEPAIAQGCLPDTISSDIHVFSGNSPGMPYLTWVMNGAGLHARAGRCHGDHQPREGDQPRAQARHPADRSARGCRDHGIGRRRRVVRRHPQQCPHRSRLFEAGADGHRRRAVRAALQLSFRGAVARPGRRGTSNAPNVGNASRMQDCHLSVIALSRADEISADGGIPAVAHNDPGRRRRGYLSNRNARACVNDAWLRARSFQGPSGGLGSR
jgi:dihydroorotase